MSYSDWSMKTTMHFIFHGVDIQSEHDTWQSSSNKNVTCGSQHHLLTVNVQLWVGGPTLHDFTKYEDPIRELNY